MMPNINGIINKTGTFVDQWKVAEFRIGVTTNSMKLRLGDQSHSLDGFNHHEPLLKDTDRAMILDWESQLQQTFDTHLKYNKKGVRRVRSLGRRPPYLLYLAWRHIDWQPEDNPRTWPANRALARNPLRVSKPHSGRAKSSRPHPPGYQPSAMQIKVPPPRSKAEMPEPIALSGTILF